MLFNKRLLEIYLNSFDYPEDYNFDSVNKIINNWQISIKNGNYDKTSEKQIQASFLNLFFNKILGHYEMNDNPDEWCMTYEVKTEFDRTATDGALGFFTKDNKNTRAVIELKDANTPLDKKQSSRKDYDSPVSQAFSYSTKFDRCDWIIVSNFKEIRLYNKERGQGYYETFEILKLNEEKEFKRFYFCLCKQNLIERNRNSLLDNLVKDTSKNEEEITKDFYKDFKALRKSLFEHICENNPNIDKMCLLEKTQKLLDRLIFVMFCEDSVVNLLPPYTIKNYYKTGKNLPKSSDTKIWDIMIKNLFEAIDKGKPDINPPINKYNGGLFAPDEILDNQIVIKDSAWDDVVHLSEYNFESDLNVNILGHIFEQSLSDLERIKAEIDGSEQDNKKSKRKIDGIFYTPEYITRYIVEQTIGKYLEENPDKLETIKILDPACGSGAFLNQAHSFLKQQYTIRTEEKINSTRSSKRGGEEFLQIKLGEHQNLAETNRSILLNNLYGVDLNSESTEITKLALWLKTAQKGQPLQNLDKNIKCGNSLIDDETIAGDKAFNWNEEFKDIMANGGFDVIIGNPPYFNIDTFGYNSPIFEYLKNRYSDIYMDKSDVLFYFIKKSIDLLKDNGVLGFIISNAFLFSDKAVKLRNYILANTSILKIVNFEQYNVFKDAGITTCILILQKNKNSDTCKVINIKEKDLTEDVVISKIQNSTNIFEVYFEKNSPYALVDYKISELNTKIDANHNKLGDILHVGKGMETAANEKFCFKEYPKEFPKKFIKNRMSGEIISRYFLAKPLEYLLYFEDVEIFADLPQIIQNHLLENREFLENRATVKNEGRVWWRYSRPMHKEYYKYDKLWCSYRAKSNEFVYDDTKSFIGLTNTTVIFGNNPDYDLKYILALLNSKTLCFRYKSIGKQTGSGIFEYFENQISKLPIVNVKRQQQQSLANKAGQIIELNKQLHEGIDSALELIKTEYQPNKISQNLEKFYTLGIHPFLEELEKQKVKLSLNQKEELINWYKDKSEYLNKIKTQIDELDNKINQEVYKLYKLTDEEIKIIEGNS